MMPEDAAMDAAFMSAAQRAGGVEPLLKAFFSFLHRRTDFYCLIPHDMEQAQMGFREGVAKTMVVNAFCSLPYKNLDGTLCQETSSDSKATSSHRAKETAHDAARIPSKPTPASTAAPSAKTSVPAPAPSQPSSLPSPPPSLPSSSSSSSSPPPSGQKEIDQLASKLRVSEDGKQIPLAGNGGVTDRYYWTQNLEELTIYLDIAANVLAKQIECKITQKALYVARNDTNKVFLEGDFPSPERVRTDECFWSLERNKDATSSTLIISLAKSRETWWDAILQGEPEIDTTQVDSTRRMEEYDEATQATIRKVMFDQRQKSQGLPTSDELAKDQILQNASQLPGSPFSSS